MFASVSRFFRSFNLFKAVIFTIGVIVPLYVSYIIWGETKFGISMALGVLFCLPTDVPGSLRHRIFGFLLAIILSVFVTILFGSLMDYFWLVFFLLGFFIFLISYFSVFGFRASLVAFSGMLAIVLSFSNNYNEVSSLTHGLFIGIGGFWFMCLSMFVSVLSRKVQTDELFIDTLEKTSEFLRIRGELLICKSNRDSLYKRIFQLQAEIIQLHEIIRELILTTHKKSGFSNRTRRQQLFFTELVEILELAVSNPVDYEKMDLVFLKHSEKLEMFSKLIFKMADRLQYISKVIRKEEKLNQDDDVISSQFRTIENEINYYKILVGLPKSREGTILLLNFKDYQIKQFQRISGLERILRNINEKNKIVSKKEAAKFITPVDYDLKKLKNNFSFKSPIFKHAFRLSIVVLIGFVIGVFFEMQNPYWILLTIIVIMRPNYGLTKARSKQRVIGTLIGAAFAVIIIFITQNSIVYSIFAIVSLPLAIYFIQHNYRNAAIFITINVIFVFALLEPNILDVISYRIYDTLIGAFLSFAGVHLLWPSWEFHQVDDFISSSLHSNESFMKEISSFYNKKGAITTKYKLKRKDAFLNVANLNAAFQRMSQDPKSKQKDISIIYELVILQNTFLSSLSSLGAYIRHNKTTEGSTHFNTFISNISSNLIDAEAILNMGDTDDKVELPDISEAKKHYKTSFENLSKIRNQEIDLGIEISNETAAQLRETHLISEQLKWLFNLSIKLKSAIQFYKS